MWSEAKAIGGQMRVVAVAGYVMAITGFTMVYGSILLLLSPIWVPLLPGMKNFDTQIILSFASDLLYLLVITAILPSGIILWFNSVVTFWKNKNLGNGIVATYNTYAQIKNIANASRNIPSAFGRITKALIPEKGSSRKSKGSVIMLAILIVVLAVLGGWMTASAIMKKADREHDGFEGLVPEKEKNRIDGTEKSPGAPEKIDWDTEQYE
jgi:hypothetical protein